MSSLQHDGLEPKGNTQNDACYSSSVDSRCWLFVVVYSLAR